MNAPKTLNGSPVIGTAPSPHGTDCLTVMVHRGGKYTPYVVATWSPSCGDAWSWGHYCDDFAQACGVVAAKALEAATRAQEAVA